MATSLLVHHYYRPSDHAEGLAAGMRVVVPVRFTRYIQVLLGCWLTAWAAVEAGTIIYVARRGFPNPLPPLPSGIPLLFLALFTTAGAFLAWRLLWVVLGREILDLSPTMIRLRREPAGFLRHDYDRSKIRDLRVGSYRRDAIYPSWGRRFVGKGDSYIAFDYEGRGVEIARGLDAKDAAYILDLIRSSGRERVTS